MQKQSADIKKGEDTFAVRGKKIISNVIIDGIT